MYFGYVLFIRLVFDAINLPIILQIHYSCRFTTYTNNDFMASFSHSVNNLFVRFSLPLYLHFFINGSAIIKYFTVGLTVLKVNLPQNFSINALIALRDKSNAVSVLALLPSLLPLEIWVPPQIRQWKSYRSHKVQITVPLRRRGGGCCT